MNAVRRGRGSPKHDTRGDHLQHPSQHSVQQIHLSTAVPQPRQWPQPCPAMQFQHSTFPGAVWCTLYRVLRATPSLSRGIQQTPKMSTAISCFDVGKLLLTSMLCSICSITRKGQLGIRTPECSSGSIPHVLCDHCGHPGLCRKDGLVNNPHRHTSIDWNRHWAQGIGHGGH